ncbi:MAG TPA: IPT/TIG domain-containing protein [Kofleriaceae bacterium]|nr:IPT/TIG domain-containing protein [Kofleriaceae bacterium]
MRGVLIALVCACGGGSGAGNKMMQMQPDGGTTSPISGVRVFFTDLTSGPNSGGEGGNGAYVTIYGNGFGPMQGSSTVTVGGGAASAYPIWTATKITVQLGAAAQTGDVVVHVAGKGDSNAVPFTVRAGNIYFVTSAGSDNANGSFAAPWATIPKAKNSLAPGDIAYLGAHAGDTIAQTTVDTTASYNCALGMSANDGANSGTADMPKALVAYPGAVATIGAETGLERGIVTPAIGSTFDHWVIAGLVLRGTDEAIDFEGGADGWRVIGNDISCPNGTGKTGCVNGVDISPTNLAFYGNDVHDAASDITAITKYYHAIYFGSSHLDLGWNQVRNGLTCRAIQFHDTGGPNEFDLHVHDNVIHDTVCDGINFSTVDPSQGVVEAYNNVIYRAGNGPDPADGSSDYAGVYVVQETDNDGSVGSGTVDIYNNTFYDCGPWTTDSSASAVHFDGSSAPSLVARLRDNIMLAKTSAERYVVGTTTGSNNLVFGATGAPNGPTATVMADPMLVDAPMYDFHLGSGSPAIDMGVDTGITWDIDGNTRPQGAAIDIGAYEYVAPQ